MAGGAQTEAHATHTLTMYDSPASGANQTLAPGQVRVEIASRARRNYSVSACHCEEHSDEAISVKVRT